MLTPDAQPPLTDRRRAALAHLDLDFYDRFFGPGAYRETDRGHFEVWHG